MTPLFTIAVRGHKAAFIPRDPEGPGGELLRCIVASILRPVFGITDLLTDEDIRVGPGQDDQIVLFYADGMGGFACVAFNEAGKSLVDPITATLSKAFNMEPT